MQKRNFVLLILMLIFALLVAACGEESTEDNTVNDEDTTVVITDIPTAEAPGVDVTLEADAAEGTGGIEGDAELAVAALLVGDFETANTYFCEDSQFDETTVASLADNSGVTYDVDCRSEGENVVCSYAPEVADAGTVGSGEDNTGAANTTATGTPGTGETSANTAGSTGTNASTPIGNPAAPNQAGQETNASGSTTLSMQGSSTGADSGLFEMTIPVVDNQLCGEYTISGGDQ